MVANFPTSLDTFTNPGPTSKQDIVSHSGQHANTNDILAVLEARIGITGSSDPMSHEYRLNHLEGAGIFSCPPPVAGSTAGKDKANVSATISAALASSYYSVGIKLAGAYDVGDLTVVLPKFGSAGPQYVTIFGPYGTVLKFSTDRGTGTFAVGVSGTEFDLYFHTIDGVAILGPGHRDAVGLAPLDSDNVTRTAMDGVYLGSRMRIKNGGCSGFRAGTVVMGNHNELADWAGPDNLYALYFANNYANAGDTYINNCPLDGALKASIAVANYSIASFVMTGGHLGFGPFAMYFEAGRTGASALAAGGISFNKTSFEQLGNCAFYDPDKYARVQGVTFIGCGSFSRGFSTYGISSQTVNPMFQLGEFFATFIDGFPDNPADGPLMDIRTTLNLTTNVWWQSYQAAVTASQSWIKVATNTPKVRLTDLVNNAEAYLAFPAQNVTAGMVLEHNGGATFAVRPWAYFGGTARGQYAGIALNGSTVSSGVPVVCVTKGDIIPVQLDGAAASSYNIVPSATNAGKATGIAYDGAGTSTGGRPLIGEAYFGAYPTSAGTSNTHVI